MSEVDLQNRSKAARRAGIVAATSAGLFVLFLTAPVVSANRSFVAQLCAENPENWTSAAAKAADCSSGGLPILTEYLVQLLLFVSLSLSATILRYRGFRVLAYFPVMLVALSELFESVVPSALPYLGGWMSLVLGWISNSAQPPLWIENHLLSSVLLLVLLAAPILALESLPVREPRISFASTIAILLCGGLGYAVLSLLVVAGVAPHGAGPMWILAFMIGLSSRSRSQFLLGAAPFVLVALALGLSRVSDITGAAEVAAFLAGSVIAMFAGLLTISVGGRLADHRRNAAASPGLDET